jgi:hypothetical protein
MTTANYLKSIFLSLWLGAALFFSFTVAPAAFIVLRGFALPNGNEIAGSIVTRTLAVINIGGLIFALLALLLTLVLAERPHGFRLALQVLSLLTLAGTTAVGQWVVAARMRALRLAMGTIDLVPPDDSRRIAFARLHNYSVSLLTAAMIAALVAIVTSTCRIRSAKSD